MLPITTLAGETHLLTNIKQVNRKRKVNGDKTLSFLTMPNAINKHAWESVVNEAVTDFLGEPYVFKTITEKSIGQSSDKQIDGIHRFFTSMIDCYQEKTFSGSLTYAAALTMVFEKTLYGFTVVDPLGAQTVENFGADNCLALFQKLLETYGAEFKIVGKQVYLYQKIGADTGFQFRWKHNVKSISKTINSNNLSTYIRGYGKLKDKQDVLSGTKLPYETRTGTFFFESKLDQFATKTVGAGFKFSFTGTGFRFKTLVTRECGVWEFNIDGSQTIAISTYRDVTFEEKILEVVRGLEHKKHNVTVKFKGADSKNPLTKGSLAIPPIAYLLEGDIIETYRELVGDERYTTVAEYKSPNATLFPNLDSPDKLRHAGVITDDKITNYDTLLAKLKANLQDEPELSITVDIAELGDDIGELNEGDRGYIIYEPMNIKVNARIVEIDETFEYINKEWTLVKTAVTLSNSSKKLTDITTRFSQTSKTVDRLLSGLEKVPFRALDDAVAEATKALLSAQTELEFVNGIIARDKTDANKLVLFNSAGLGITNDGGQNFKTAITGDGIVAESIMAGIIRGAIIASESDESVMWTQGGDIRLTDTKRGRYLNLNPQGMTGFDNNGDILFMATKTWVTSGILGTNTTNVYLAAESTGEARIVNIAGIPGDGLVDSYNYIPLRASGFYGNFWNINGGVNGIHLYARPFTDGELRVTLNGTTDQYRDLRAREVMTNSVVSNSLHGLSRHLYLKTLTEGEIRATLAGTTESYIPVRASGYYGAYFDTTATHAYVRPAGDPGELRVTVRGTTDVYQPVRAKDFITDTSMRENKTNIETYSENTLDIVRNGNAYLYNRTTDKEGARKQLGMMIDELPEETHSAAGDSFALYAMSGFQFKVDKDIIAYVDELEARIKKLESA